MAEIINMPKLGFDMQEGQLISWLKSPGDDVSQGDILAEIESDKATVEVEAFVEGTILQHLVSVDDWVPVGAPIAVIGEAGEEVDLDALGVAAAEPAAASVGDGAAASAPAADDVTPLAAPSPEVVGGNGHGLPAGVRASPLARRLAEERGIDIARVSGSGPAGRIVKADVEAFKEVMGDAPAAPITSHQVSVGHVSVTPYEDDEIIETSRIRQRIGQRMVESKQTTPHFYVTTEIDMGPAMDLRKDLNGRLAEDENGVKISVNDIIVKAAAISLRDFPNLNAAFNGDTIVRRKHINIGSAVAVPNGLLNVVVHDADEKPLTKVAMENAERIGRAREGKIRPEDVEGESFTVSNLGPWKVDHFIAIINPPEAAIMAVGSAARVPVVEEDGTLGVGWRMKATVSADHRVTDGAEVAQYLLKFKQTLEDPLRLLM